jgi:hypothetical protein
MSPFPIKLFETRHQYLAIQNPQNKSFLEKNKGSSAVNKTSPRAK